LIIIFIAMRIARDDVETVARTGRPQRDHLAFALGVARSTSSN